MDPGSAVEPDSEPEPDPLGTGTGMHSGSRFRIHNTGNSPWGTAWYGTVQYKYWNTDLLYRRLT